ncbi:HET domain-containing protein [Candidatus Bathyarchaeota archaeon]|nr:HET domain-containing protein [Candidatus Bathyarchaeota archaeon]
MAPSHANLPHPPLQDSSRQIRLLSVHEDAEAEISCRVSVFDLSGCPRFIALSYVWGSPAVQHEITLNGHAFPIRSNLYSALKSISKHIKTMVREQGSANTSPQDVSSEIDAGEHNRFQQSPGCWEYFWVDAICIHQQNVSERNHQVRMMSRIYERAAFVLAWLGLGCERALRLLATADPAQLRSVYMPYTYSFQKSEFSEALIPFLESDYWTRMWIVQEFVLARDVVFASGPVLVPWDRANKVFPEVYGYHARSGYGSAATLVNERRQQMFRQKQGVHPNLHELVRRFGLLECSDPRDKIFALSGLLGASSEDVLIVDYSLTPAQLSIKTLKLASKSVKIRAQLEEIHAWFKRVLGINAHDSDGEYYEVGELMAGAVQAGGDVFIGSEGGELLAEMALGGDDVFIASHPVSPQAFPKFPQDQSPIVSPFQSPIVSPFQSPIVSPFQSPIVSPWQSPIVSSWLDSFDEL